MAILFEGSDPENEKKVRFDESVELHETFPTHHHTATLHESKNKRRKERSGIFWDADLQAEFETWRVNSPNLSGSGGTRRNKRAAGSHSNQQQQQPRDKEPYLISRGQSKAIRNLMKQHRITPSASSSLSRSSTAPTTPLTPLEKPDLLKHINEQFKEAHKKEQLQQEAATQHQSNAPPVPARKNAWKRKKQQKKFKVTDENIQHSLRKYHSIDIGQALQDIDSLSSVPTTPSEMRYGERRQRPEDLSSVPTTPREIGYSSSIGLNSSGNSAASTPLDYEKLFYGDLPSPQLASTPINDSGEAGRMYEPIPSPLSYTTDENSVSMEPFSFLSLEEPPAGPPTPPVRVNGTHRRNKNKEQQAANGKSKRNSFKELLAMKTRKLSNTEPKSSSSRKSSVAEQKVSSSRKSSNAEQKISSSRKSSNAEQKVSSSRKSSNAEQNKVNINNINNTSISQRNSFKESISTEEVIQTTQNDSFKEYQTNSNITTTGSTKRDSFKGTLPLNSKKGFKEEHQSNITNTNTGSTKRDSFKGSLPLKNNQQSYTSSVPLSITKNIDSSHQHHQKQPVPEHATTTTISPHSPTTLVTQKLTAMNLEPYQSSRNNNSRPSSERSISPMVRNLRYKDMGNNYQQQPEDIYQPASLYLAQSGNGGGSQIYGRLDRVRSYSADDLIDGPYSGGSPSVMKPFTDYIYDEDDDGKTDLYNPVSSVGTDDNYLSKTMFSRKKKV